jgi:hypothetical protein
MNDVIRQAVEGYKDDKIQYVDIDPALEGYRFCEWNHTKSMQYNWSPNVYLWNNPAKWATTIKNGDDVQTYDPLNGVLPPQDIIDKLEDLEDAEPRQEGHYYILTWANAKYPKLSRCGNSAYAGRIEGLN